MSTKGFHSNPPALIFRHVMQSTVLRFVMIIAEGNLLYAMTAVGDTNPNYTILELQ